MAESNRAFGVENDSANWSTCSNRRPNEPISKAVVLAVDPGRNADQEEDRWGQSVEPELSRSARPFR